MIPISLFDLGSEDVNKHEYLKQLLSFPTGYDPYQYNVKRDPYYSEALKRITDSSRVKLSGNIEHCFYCGTQTDNIVPAFFHDGSGINLWIYTDWKCSALICHTCHENYGSSNVRYKNRVRKINRGNSRSLLHFEPEIVLPTIEPVHLHFNYLDDGRLVPLSQRAKATIERLSLNRKELVSRRLCAIENYRTNYDSFEYSSLESPIDSLFIASVEVEVDDDGSFSDYLLKRVQRDSIFYDDLFNDITPIPLRSESFKPIEIYKRDFFSYTFSGISSIKFDGIRGFDINQKLEFNGKNSLIILGENGVGKSTVLELLKRALKPRYKKHLDDLCNSIDTLPTYEIEYTDENYHYIYGSDKKSKGLRDKCNLIHVSENRSHSKTPNLLAQWVWSQHKNDQLIHWVARKLKTLLDLPQDYYFCTIDGKVYWETESNDTGRVYITDLSSGYNSLLTIFYMVMSGITEKEVINDLNLIEKRLSSTLVLVDEVELHLHPRFKKKVVSNLKETFPEVIFVFTTHDPLVIKSANNNEHVIVLEKNNNVNKSNVKTRIIDTLPDHTHLTTEQILSSPIFGLGTMCGDDSIQKQVDNYYVALRNNDIHIINEHRKILGKTGFFGSTFRELLALSAVDAYISKGVIPKTDDIEKILEKAENHEKD